MNQGVLIAGSVVLAGALIAGAILVRDGGNVAGAQDREAVDRSEVRDIQPDDHRLGAENPKVTIVEYSDFECPFCARFHPTVARILEEYPNDVAWVYRHFPLTQIHAEAGPSAIASECVAELGGNEAFWNFADVLFANQQSLGLELYTREAVTLGIDEAAFVSCFESEKYEAVVGEEYNEAVGAGGRGTPFSILITADGEQIPVSGALPYEQLKGAVEQAISGS